MKKIILLFALIFFTNLSFSQIDNEHLNIGDLAPPINGIDQFDKVINSDDILKEQKVLLVFYRGNWCPYCRKHLASLQENLEGLKKKGLYVIVITPEKVEKINETTKDMNATFSILHDANDKIMKDYKVAFEVNRNNVTSYFGVTQKKIRIYNDENNNTLPVPATYLINKDGKISYVHYNPDYHERSDFREIIEML
jgi:peroxiredoxin